MKKFKSDFGKLNSSKELRKYLTKQGYKELADLILGKTLKTSQLKK